jgi:hypothetical protein
MSDGLGIVTISPDDLGRGYFLISPIPCWLKLTAGFRPLHLHPTPGQSRDHNASAMIAKCNLSQSASSAKIVEKLRYPGGHGLLTLANPDL